MQKKKEVSFECEEIRSHSTGTRIKVIVEDVDIKSLMTNIPDDEFIKYVRNNWNAEDIFEKDRLEDWAERNGYTKETINICKEQ